MIICKQALAAMVLPFPCQQNDPLASTTGGSIKTGEREVSALLALKAELEDKDR